MMGADSLNMIVGERVIATHIEPMSLMRNAVVVAADLTGTIVAVRSQEGDSPLQVRFEGAGGSETWWVRSWERAATEPTLAEFKKSLLVSLLREAEKNYNYETGYFDAVFVKAGYTQEEITEGRREMNQVDYTVTVKVRSEGEADYSMGVLVSDIRRSIEHLTNIELVDLTNERMTPALNSSDNDDQEEDSSF